MNTLQTFQKTPGPRDAGAILEDLPTFGLIALCYGIWALATTLLCAIWLPAGIAITALAIALHSSLQHEVIHGHPFASRHLNAVLVSASVGLFIPFLRFRDTHLAHHQDSRLTDPYDDPETNYFDPAVWEGLPNLVRVALTFNNTLLGRLIIGPAVGLVMFVSADFRAIRAGDHSVLVAWLAHIPAVAIILFWLIVTGEMPLWAYLIAAYIGLSILKIRTFLEHQAHEHSCARTVVVEDRGLLSLLFLNNNFHIVHHMHPDVSWYRLPSLYFANRERYLSRNQGYSYPSYRDVFRKYFLRTKDPVSHPLWPKR